MRLFAAGGGSDETDGSRDRSNQRKVGSIPRNFQYALTGFSGSVVWRQFMSGKHGHSHKPFEGHMHDFDAHIRAVEEDLEYYRAKRFEPRIFYLLRRGVVTFADLLKARVALKRKNQFFKTRKPQGKNIEARVRYLEEWLDEYVKGIVLVSARAVEAMDMVTEDNRKERGDYDDFFKIKKKEHHGTLEERMVNVEQDLKDYQELLEVFVQALIHRGWSTRGELEQRWKQLHEERPWTGGVIVAKAWTDATFKQALLTTGREALREMGIKGKSASSWSWRIRTLCTMLSCARYVPVIRTTFSATRRGGISTKATEPRSCRIRARACRKCSGWRFPRAKKFKFTTALPTYATSSCRNVPLVQKGCRKKSWLSSSPSIV